MLESRLIERGMNPLTKKPKPKQKYTMKIKIALNAKGRELFGSLNRVNGEAKGRELSGSLNRVNGEAKSATASARYIPKLRGHVKLFRLLRK